MTACATPDDAYRAGYADGGADEPLSADEARRLAAILAPHVTAGGQDDAAVPA